MEPLKLNILGGFTLVDRSGAPLGLAAKKARALLAYLALAGGPVPRDRLATLLWEDRDEAQARSSLRQALSALRRALGDAADALRADTETVALDPDLVAVDARDFEAAAAGPSTTAQERAAALYRGDLLDGLDARAPAFDDWLRGERQRLLGLAIAVLGRRLDAALEKGADAAALQAATRLVVLDPAQEPAHRALMRLHARQGRRTDALKQYRRLETVLRRELAVAPEPETQQLYADILNRRDAPAATTSPAPAAAPSPRAPISDSAPAPELRQASVLYADLCGFTAMTAALDPEQVHAVTGRFFQVVDALVMAHGGTVHRHIGDNVMAVFGVPVAHGNDAQRAVATARAVHAAMAGMAADLRAEVGPDLDQNLAAHVGIASGPVI
ncbi:MAG: hypothetical protein KDE22_15920, partial [Rhodobacterales bacterium]|nr:hypothetical protein [Rhodobacterales bacterium]